MTDAGTWALIYLFAHANIGGCGACRTSGCPCPKFHDKPIPEECECEVCWRESNMPPAGCLLDPL
jgi:hypothetical protein